MSISRRIKLLVSVILLYLLPCSAAYSQIAVNESVVVSQNVEEAGSIDEGGKKIWDRLKFWKGINFNIFKFKKGEKDTLSPVSKVEPVKGPKMNTQVSVGTNLLSWAYFGTANLESSISIGRHITAFAGGKYNSLVFNTKAEKEIFHKQTTGYAGIKWWPWFVNSGWWIGLKGQYSDFSTAGILSSYQEDGVAVGSGLSGGYSFMLGRHFNLDIGVGVWGGAYLDYSNYEKPEEKRDMFIKFDNIQVSLIYFF